MLFLIFSMLLGSKSWFFWSETRVIKKKVVKAGVKMLRLKVSEGG